MLFILMYAVLFLFFLRFVNCVCHCDVLLAYVLIKTILILLSVRGPISVVYTRFQLVFYSILSGRKKSMLMISNKMFKTAGYRIKLWFIAIIL